ncbi:element excision factor XisI family protein [Spirulina sp. CS-785/01]|uniref:element excision factor XisI family protein n=1 Tax=Spirulina sp. CS-785/01 TaxID=3021716 RepID=UPI00232B2586|nr:element excision factor XisI family protein [Spirulina sp. CS-785/01]MDB9315232.1 element excision factor XisI family protein [Spirulina sp. CS-785/01]
MQDEVEARLMFDELRDRCQLIYIGWHQGNRVFGPVLHWELREGKVWLEWNGTEDESGEILVEQGIPKTDMVVGFHPPSLNLLRFC